MRSLISLLTWSDTANGDEAKAEVSYLGKHSVERRFISERSKDDGFSGVPSHLEPLEPGRPAIVESLFHPKLVVRRPRRAAQVLFTGLIPVSLS